MYLLRRNDDKVHWRNSHLLQNSKLVWLLFRVLSFCASSAGPSIFRSFHKRNTRALWRAGPDYLLTSHKYLRPRPQFPGWSLHPEKQMRYFLPKRFPRNFKIRPCVPIRTVDTGEPLLPTLDSNCHILKYFCSEKDNKRILSLPQNNRCFVRYQCMRHSKQ